jgi:hypothetical protein
MTDYARALGTDQCTHAYGLRRPVRAARPPTKRTIGATETFPITSLTLKARGFCGAVETPGSFQAIASDDSVALTECIPSNSAMRRSISLITRFENGPRCMYSAISITM